MPYSATLSHCPRTANVNLQGFRWFLVGLFLNICIHYVFYIEDVCGCSGLGSYFRRATAISLWSGEGHYFEENVNLY